MGDIAVTMSRAAYAYYLKSRKDGGGGLRDKQELVKYLNDTGRYRGNVVDVHVEADPIRKPRAKDED